MESLTRSKVLERQLHSLSGQGLVLHHTKASKSFLRNPDHYHYIGATRKSIKVIKFSVYESVTLHQHTSCRNNVRYLTCTGSAELPIVLPAAYASTSRQLVADEDGGKRPQVRAVWFGWRVYFVIRKPWGQGQKWGIQGSARATVSCKWLSTHAASAHDSSAERWFFFCARPAFNSRWIPRRNPSHFS